MTFFILFFPLFFFSIYEEQREVSKLSQLGAALLRRCKSRATETVFRHAQPSTKLSLCFFRIWQEQDDKFENIKNIEGKNALFDRTMS